VKTVAIFMRPFGKKEHAQEFDHGDDDTDLASVSTFCTVSFSNLPDLNRMKVAAWQHGSKDTSSPSTQDSRKSQEFNSAHP